MSVVTKEQLENAAVDAQTFEDVANGGPNFGGDGIVHPRLGGGIKTLAKAIADISQIIYKGDWAATTTYNIKDVVTEGSNLYYCVENHTSGATFDDTKWIIYGNNNVSSIEYLQLTQLDKNRILGALRTGSLQAVVLGDSTKAGVGGGGGVYGQCNTSAKSGISAYLWHHLAQSDPEWVGLGSITDSPHYKAYYPMAGLLEVPFDKWDFIVSTHDETIFSCRQNQSTVQTQFTVYYVERTSDTAPTFDLTVSEDSDFSTSLVTETIDSYTAIENFNGIEVGVNGRIVKHTVTMSSTSGRTVYVKIDNLGLIDRGNGLASDGTLVVVGFAFGSGVEVRNLAVSSTTLKNNSSANQTRGVTTAGRLAAAQALGSNMFVIGWGTSDSKAGVSDPATFKQEYLDFVDDIRATEPEAVIILSTAPEGAPGSQYENNVFYNAVVRQVAKEKACSLLDVESLFKFLPSGAYADDVHPSYDGYRAESSAIIGAIGITNREPYNLLKIPDSGALAPVGGENLIPFSENATESPTDVHTVFINRPDGKSYLDLRCKLNLGRATEMDNAQFIMQLRGWSEPDGAGTPTGWVKIDVTTTNEGKVPVTTGNALGVSVLDDFYGPGSQPSYEIRVQGLDYRLSTVGKSKINWRWF